MRFAPMSVVAGKLINFQVADDVQKHQLGLLVTAQSYDYASGGNQPNGGGAQFMYVRGAATFAVGRAVHINKDLNLLDVPATGNTGRPVYIVMSPFSSAAPFGWVCVSGIVPALFSVAATVGAVFGGTAGNLTPTAAAGRHLLNATTLIAADSTWTKPATQTRNGSAFVRVSDVSGLFPGLTVSGTGISGTILAVDQDGREVKLSANASATGSITMTLTPTGYGIVQINNAFVQGQIT